MSETTLTQDAIQAIRNRESVTVYMTRDLGSEAKTVVITPEERRALCDAAARAEALEAQLTEVTRERDELLRQRNSYPSDFDPSLRQHERDVTEIVELRAALAPLRAVVEAAKRVICGRDGLLLTGGLEECEARAALQHALSALPADPSAPTPR